MPTLDDDLTIKVPDAGDGMEGNDEEWQALTARQKPKPEIAISTGTGYNREPFTPCK